MTTTVDRMNAEAYQQQNDTRDTDSLPARRTRCTCGVYLPGKPTKPGVYRVDGDGVRIEVGSPLTHCCMCRRVWREEDLWD